MRNTKLSDAAENATIDRKDFDAALKKLLRAKAPITKAEISRKVKSASSEVKHSAQR